MSAPSVEPRGGKMFAYINHQLHVTLGDGRSMTGKFIAFDKHMNLVLAGARESRVSGKSPTGVLERDLGLVLLRGEHVVAVRAEGKAAPEASAQAAAPAGGKSRIQ